MDGLERCDAAGDNLTWIDQQADAFEQVWRRGERPRIEDYLGAAIGAIRISLIEELLMIEWQRRLARGERPVAEEYLDRFPECARWIQYAQPGPATALETTADMTPAATSTPEETCLFGEYETLMKVGGGGMGVVYLARKRTQLHGGLLALKVIAEHLISPCCIEYFVTEMRTQARLQHPHIVQVLDSGQEQGRPYFTMSFYRGSDLSRVLKQHGPLEPRTAALYVLRIAWAVRYLHEQAEPIVHRDLKPQNILLDQYCDGSFPFGRPYLADFGLVKVLDESTSVLARGVIEGTIPYMSPEQVDGSDPIGPASDVWGLGVILFECLTGQRPFRGDTAAEIFYQILQSETPAPRSLRPEIPADLQRICLKCLKRPLASRYQSAAALIEDLDCFLLGQPLRGVTPDGIWEQFVRWTRRSPALAARLAVIVVCSIIIWSHRLYGGFAPLDRNHPVQTMILPRIGVTMNSSVTSAALAGMSQVILVAWGLISWMFQRQLGKSARDDGIQLGWRIADVAALVLLIQLDDALMSPLTIAFAVLIVASAFGSRPDQIIQATLLSMSGYGFLIFTYWLSHGSLDRHYRHLHYLVGLTILCVMLVFQAQRTRALARISEERIRS